MAAAQELDEGATVVHPIVSVAWIAAHDGDDAKITATHE